jgi:hypothetical protein
MVQSAESENSLEDNEVEDPGLTMHSCPGSDQEQGPVSTAEQEVNPPLPVLAAPGLVARPNGQLSELPVQLGSQTDSTAEMQHGVRNFDAVNRAWTCLQQQKQQCDHVEHFSRTSVQYNSSRNVWSQKMKGREEEVRRKAEAELAEVRSCQKAKWEERRKEQEAWGRNQPSGVWTSEPTSLRATVGEKVESTSTQEPSASGSIDFQQREQSGIPNRVHASPEQQVKNTGLSVPTQNPAVKQDEHTSIERPDRSANPKGQSHEATAHARNRPNSQSPCYMYKQHKKATPKQYNQCLTGPASVHGLGSAMQSNHSAVTPSGVGHGQAPHQQEGESEQSALANRHPQALGMDPSTKQQQNYLNQQWSSGSSQDRNVRQPGKPSGNHDENQHRTQQQDQPNYQGSGENRYHAQQQGHPIRQDRQGSDTQQDYQQASGIDQPSMQRLKYTSHQSVDKQNYPDNMDEPPMEQTPITEPSNTSDESDFGRPECQQRFPQVYSGQQVIFSPDS